MTGLMGGEARRPVTTHTADGFALADGHGRVKPYADPDMREEYDEDGEPIPGTRTAGWDVSFGCRVNFGPDPDGKLRVSVRVSDQAKRAGLAVSPTTPSQLRQLARALSAVADENDPRTLRDNTPGQVDSP